MGHQVSLGIWIPSGEALFFFPNFIIIIIIIILTTLGTFL